MFGQFIRREQNGFERDVLRWGFHVAPIIRLADLSLYILDPLLSEGPMTKEDAHLEIGNPNNNGYHPDYGHFLSSYLTGYVTCKPETYDHDDDCFEPDNTPSKPDYEHDVIIFDTDSVLDL